MSKICIENVCYGTKRGFSFTALSNCTIKLAQPVIAGGSSGYLGVATHKDSTQRRFFLPHNGDAVAGVVNYGEASFKRMFFNIPSSMVRTLVGDLVDVVDIPDHIMKAVNIVGKNVGWDKEPIWVLSKSMAINQYGWMVDPTTQGLIWIGHLVQGNNKDVAIHEEGCNISNPLSTLPFDTMCHFMAGTLPYRLSIDAEMTEFVSNAFSKLPEEIAIQASFDDPTEERNQSLLSAFFLAAQSLIISNYEEMSRIFNT